MPLVQELPTTTTTRASHGWAYVPDIGPSKAIAPGTRKRGAAREGAVRKQDGGAKQAKIIQTRLADLEKENYKETTIPIPPRPKDKNRKITPNVRRILTYQRTFAHYLADEEAQLALGGGSSIVAGPATASKSGSTRTQATPIRTQQLPMHPPPKPPTPRTAAGIKQESAPALPSPQPPAPTLSPDNDPLLRSHTPKPPSARVMAALLAEPPLSYNAARATSSPDSGSVQPPRHFCAICGYWGKVKCRRCGERTCGLMECWKGHEAGCRPY